MTPRPVGCADSAFCLWLGGDAVGAGQVRRQELSGSVQGGGRFVEDRVEGLEDVRDAGGDVEGDFDVGGGGLVGQADGVVEENLVGSGLDDQRRQAATADVQVTLDITPGVPHVFQAYHAILDEAAAALDRAGQLLSAHLASAERVTA